MKIGDVYKHKENNSVIQIDSFANPMGRFEEGKMLVIFRKIYKINEFEFESFPVFDGYGTSEEIENEYELFVSAEDLRNYNNWNEILELVEN